LLPGTYSVNEAVPPGWELSSATCSDGSNPAAIQLDPEETVTCTFLNRDRRGTIIIEKQTEPAGSTEVFTFDTSYAPGGFELSDGESNTSPKLLPGTYSVNEIVPDGSVLRSATCSDGSAPATIQLDPEETVTCTFVNEVPFGKIIVEKQTLPGGSTQVFRFEASYDPDGFGLSDGQSNQSQPLFPGTYSVAEVVPPGWQLTSARCSDGSAPAAIQLDPGETVTCTFVNASSPRGTIVVEKQTEPAGSSEVFRFSTSYDTDGFGLSDGQRNTSPQLPTGTYSVSEAVPDGWELSSATCSDGSAPAAIQLAPGETVTCTFVNRDRRGTVIVEKQTVPAGSGEVFTFEASYDTDGFELSDGQRNTSPQLPAGTYSVREVVPPGWELTTATCSDGSDPAAIQLDPEDTVTCTFVNTESELLFEASSVCIDDVPYIRWSVAPIGIDVQTVTVTLFDLDGNQLTIDEPPAGFGPNDQILYPGASVDPPDWPGWKLEDGEWVIDPTDARLRDGVRVLIEVNPSGEQVVSYPEATAACANPPDAPGPELEIEALLSVCQSETPYVSFVLTGDDIRPTYDSVSLSLYDVDGELVRSEAVPSLAELVIYPGATARPPDWPGWIVDEDGAWQPDPTDQQLANGGKFVLEVNGAEVDSEAFPAIPDGCDGPPDEEPEPPPVQGRIWPACQDGIPHLGYEVLLSNDDVDQLVVTIVDLDGNEIDRLEAQQVEGLIAYPGSSLDPRGWPGWKLAGDGWVSDPTTTRLRDGGTLIFDAGPGRSVAVAYPAVPAGCDTPSGPVPTTEPPTVSGTWRCVADPSAGFDYEVTVTDDDDASVVELRLLDEDGVLIEQQTGGLTGSIRLPPSLVEGATDQLVLTLELAVRTTGTIDVTVDAPNCEFVVVGDVIAILSDAEATSPVQCGSTFSYEALFFNSPPPEEDPTADEPDATFEVERVEARLGVPLRRMFPAGSELSKIEDGELRIPIESFELAPGEVRKEAVPVLADVDFGTVVVANLYLSAENSEGTASLFTLADSEPTIIRTPCADDGSTPAAVTGDNS